MVANHRERGLPKGQPHLGRGIHFRKDGAEAVEQHGVKGQRAHREHDEHREHAPVTQQAVARHDDSEHQQSAARIGERKTDEQGQHEYTEQRALLPPADLDEKAEGDAECRVEVARENIGVHPGGKDTLRELGKGLCINPAHIAGRNTKNRLPQAIEHTDHG